MLNNFKKVLIKQSSKNDQKIGSYFLVFLFLVSVLYSSQLYDSYHAPKNILLGVFSGVLVPVLVIFYVFKKRLDQIKLSIFGILLFIRIIYLSSVTPEKLTSIEFTLFILISLFIIFWLGLNLNENSRKDILKLILGIVFISGISQSFIGSYQFLFMPEFPSNIVKTNVIGSFGSSNALGNWLCLTMISGAYWFLKSKRKWVIGICLIFVATILILTESRAATLTLIFAYSAWFILSKRSKILGTLLILSLVCIITALLFYYDIDSSTGRLYIWQISLEMFKDNFLNGIGIGNFGNEFISYQGDFLLSHPSISPSKAAYVRSPHNEFFQAYIEGGLLGGSIFLGSFTYCMYISIKRVLEDRSTINLAALLILLVLFSHSLIDSVLHFTPQLVLLYFLFGFYDESISFTMKLKASFIFLICAGLITYSSFFIREQLVGRYLWDKGIDYSKQEAPLISEHYFKTALQYLPKNGELLFNYGATISLNGEHERGLYFMNIAQTNFLDKNLLISKGNAFYELSEYQKSLEIADLILYYYPDLLAPHLIKAKSYFEMGNLEASKKELIKCINQETDIRSSDTQLIADEALYLWKKYQF